MTGVQQNTTMKPQTPQVKAVGVTVGGSSQPMKATVAQDASRPGTIDTSMVYRSVFSSPLWTVFLVVVIFSLVGYFLLKWWADYYVKKKTDRLIAQFKEEQEKQDESSGSEEGE